MRTVFYAVVGRSLHKLSAPCEHLDPAHPDATGTVEITYERFPFKPDASFSCSISQKGKARAPTGVTTHEAIRRWTFAVGGQALVRVETGTSGADTKQAELFALALVDALVGTPSDE